MKRIITRILIIASCTALLPLQAQNDTVNPLWSTTGPSIINNGALQWDNSANWIHSNLNKSVGVTRSNYTYGKSILRLGIGSKSELTLGYETGQLAYHYVDSYSDSTDSQGEHDSTMWSLSPQVGMRMSLCDGEGWRPQITFNTHIAYTFRNWSDNIVEPSIGLEFRNRIGQRWAIDYSLGYTWNKYQYGEVNNTLTWSWFIRWQATEKFMLGLGMERYASKFSALYQWNDCLQLSLVGRLQGGWAPVSSTSSYDLSLGFSWRIK